jgi:hypothetical protein
VEDAVDTGYGTGRYLGIGQVAADKFHAVAQRGQVFKLSGAEIIDDPNAVATRDEGLCDIRSDETGPAGNQKRPGSHDGLLARYGK